MKTQQSSNLSDALNRWIAVEEAATHGAPSTVSLSDVLSDTVVFESPVVFTPQEGKPITMRYLQAALQVLKQDFTYTDLIEADGKAALVFECKVGDIAVNGVDLLRFDDEGRIVSFKVMIRPLKAIQAVHAAMAAELAQAA